MRRLNRDTLLLIALCFSFAASAVADPTKLRLTFVGDLMVHELLFQTASYQDIYRGVADVLAASDLTFANLEFPVDSTRPVSGYPLFNAHTDYVRAAVEAGIDVLSTANNHAFDGREEGVLQTVRSLASLANVFSHRFFFSGIRGNPRSPFVPQTIVVNGVRIGFIALAQFLNQSDGGRYVHVVDYLDQEEADGFVRFVKEASPFYDLFVVSYHGDREYVAEPDPAKRAFFHRLVENGAHIVFAHHPHVLQEYELVTVQGQKRLIMYSMGNFISGMAWRESPPDPDGWIAPTGDSIMLTVEVVMGAGGPSISRAAPVPIADYRNPQGEMVVLKLDDLAGGKVGASPSWVSYYRARRSRMEKFLAPQSQAAPPEVRTAARPE